MRRICPRCKRLLNTDETSCPTCGCPVPPLWYKTPAGRIMIGLLVAEMVSFQAYSTLVVIAGLFGDESKPGEDFSKLINLQISLLAGMWAGGLIAGTRQRHGARNGAIVGALGGCLFVIILDVLERADMGPLVLLVVPFFCVLAGASGGFVAQMVLPADARAMPRERRPGKRRPPEPLFPHWSNGPLHWPSACHGAAVAAVGTLGARWLFQVTEGLAGVPSTRLQEKFVVFELSAVAVFFGGVLAGAQGANPFKQGVCAGLLACAAVVAARTPLEDPELARVVHTIASCVLLMATGSVFGRNLWTSKKSWW